MRRLAAAGAPIKAVWLTRGGLHGDRREAESRRAMELIGVKPGNLLFFRLPDGHLLDFLDDITLRLEKLFKRMKPASLFVPAFEGGHPDHDAVQLAAAAAIGRLGGQSRNMRQFPPLRESQTKRQFPSARESQTSPPALYEFPLYHRASARVLKVGEFLPGAESAEQGFVEQTSMKLTDRLMKRKLVIAFRSQRLILWPLTGLKGGPMMVHMKGEPYRRVPSGRDYTVRPHQGRLAYEYYTPVRFKRFAEAAARVISPVPLRAAPAEKDHR